jgi:hypothetical protein
VPRASRGMHSGSTSSRSSPQARTQRTAPAMAALTGAATAAAAAAKVCLPPGWRACRPCSGHASIWCGPSCALGRHTATYRCVLGGCDTGGGLAAMLLLLLLLLNALLLIAACRCCACSAMGRSTLWDRQWWSISHTCCWTTRWSVPWWNDLCAMFKLCRLRSATEQAARAPLARCCAGGAVLAALAASPRAQAPRKATAQQQQAPSGFGWPCRTGGAGCCSEWGRAQLLVCVHARTRLTQQTQARQLGRPADTRHGTQRTRPAAASALPLLGPAACRIQSAACG